MDSKSNKAILTGVSIEVSIDCMELLSTDVDIVSEFGKLGDEVTYNNMVTVKKDVTDAYTYHELSNAVGKLKSDMENKKRELLRRIS